jgi:hypothetical protein
MQLEYLLINQALFIAGMEDKPHYEEVLHASIGVLFVNTPHRGSEACKSMSFASRFVPNIPRLQWSHLAKGNDIEVFRFLRSSLTKRRIVSMHSLQDLPLSSKTVCSYSSSNLSYTNDAYSSFLAKRLLSTMRRSSQQIHLFKMWPGSKIPRTQISVEYFMC